MGFYIKSSWMDQITDIKGVSEPISFIKVKIGKGIKMMIVQVYAPTLGSMEEEKEAIYNELDEILLTEREYYKLIIGDWNAKVGREDHPQKMWENMVLV